MFTCANAERFTAAAPAAFNCETDALINPSPVLLIAGNVPGDVIDQPRNVSPLLLKFEIVLGRSPRRTLRPLRFEKRE